MEQLFNGEFLIIEDEHYFKYENSLKCPLCYNILFNPIICKRCNTTFCKNCISKLNNNCPNKCDSSFQKNTRIEDILKDFHYKSNKLEKIYKYEELKVINPNIINKKYNSNSSKITRISNNDYQENDYKKIEKGYSNLN